MIEYTEEDLAKAVVIAKNENSTTTSKILLFALEKVSGENRLLRKADHFRFATKMYGRGRKAAFGEAWNKWYDLPTIAFEKWLQSKARASVP